MADFSVPLLDFGGVAADLDFSLSDVKRGGGGGRKGRTKAKARSEKRKKKTKKKRDTGGLYDDIPF